MNNSPENTDGLGKSGSVFTPEFGANRGAAAHDDEDDKKVPLDLAKALLRLSNVRARQVNIMMEMMSLAYQYLPRNEGEAFMRAKQKVGVLEEYDESILDRYSE